MSFHTHTQDNNHMLPGSAHKGITICVKCEHKLSMLNPNSVRTALYAQRIEFVDFIYFALGKMINKSAWAEIHILGYLALHKHISAVLKISTNAGV